MDGEWFDLSVGIFLVILFSLWLKDPVHTDSSSPVENTAKTIRPLLSRIKKQGLLSFCAGARRTAMERKLPQRDVHGWDGCSCTSCCKSMIWMCRCCLDVSESAPMCFIVAVVAQVCTVCGPKPQMSLLLRRTVILKIYKKSQILNAKDGAFTVRWELLTSWLV